jgi:ribose/xylose/arabinose/galactoside ABC-type transport system permease subunit
MGFLVAWLNIPSIVVTLGFLSILKGGLIMATGGAWIANLPPGYALAQMEPLGVAMPIWFMVILTAAAAFWMRNSALGRSIYAVGGNAEAARLAGIDRRSVVLKVFLIHGAFAGIASVLFATQLSVIQSTVPANLELTIITASVVGGVSILGGIGTVIGSTLAAILIAAIASSLVFLSVSPYWIRAVQGVLILATVLADLWRRRRQAIR